MLVGKRMTRNPITIPPDISIAEAMEWMRREKVRRFPVVDKKGKLVGIVTREDLLHASPSSVTSLSVWEVSYLLSQVKVKEVMTRNVTTVTEDVPLEEASRLMADNKIGSLPVLRDGMVVGIITESVQDLPRAVWRAGKGHTIDAACPLLQGIAGPDQLRDHRTGRPHCCPQHLPGRGSLQLGMYPQGGRHIQG
jgi:CBS domain-containing protein